jgi:hypothetical protein
MGVNPSLTITAKVDFRRYSPPAAATSAINVQSVYASPAALREPPR